MTRDRLDLINRYIELATAPGPAHDANAPRGVLPFVTISRESGAGGQQLATGEAIKVGDKFGLRIREILAETAEN